MKPASPHSALLIHGGIAENIGAEQFWIRPGIASQLEEHGWHVLAPDRDTTPSSWNAAAAEMADLLDGPGVVVGGSNGVSVALRLALEQPDLVSRLVLLWPATAGDIAVDRQVSSTAAHLLVGETVRGVTDTELASLQLPVAVMAADPEDDVHQHRTVESLVAAIPGAIRIEDEFPESPRPDFARRAEEFVSVLLRHLD